MFIIKFNNMVKNKWIWAAFAIVVAVAFGASDIMGLFGRNRTPEGSLGTLGGKPVDGVHQHRHHPLDLPLARAGQKRHVAPLQGPLEIVAVHGVQQRVAGIDERDALLREIRHFEGKNNEEPVHPGLQLAVTPFARSPGLRGDVPEDADAARVAPFRNLHIEAGIVDQDHHVRLPGRDVPLAGTQVPQQLARLGKHVGQAHHRAFAVMAHKLHSRLLHQFAAPSAQLCGRVLGEQAADQVASVQVARGFAGYQKIAHRR